VIEAAKGANKCDSPKCDAGPDASTGQDTDLGNLLDKEAPHDTRKLRLLTDIIKPHLCKVILILAQRNARFYLSQSSFFSIIAILYLSD
jgi:hypothetical protein